MKSILLIISLVFGFSAVWAEEVFPSAKRHNKSMPTVPEANLPPLSNQKGNFRGAINRSDFWGYTWVNFPHVENPGSFGFDRQGRLYVAEANRFWLGVPDLRGANPMIRGDFQTTTVEERLAMYEKFKGRFPSNWFTKVPDRIIRLEDRDNNRAADHRTLFSDHFKQAESGIGFSVLSDEDNTVYFTCIPHVWKITDSNDDGVADKHEPIASGFGSRISFIGHDLHGIIRGPDGMLYFSIGDRGYQITDTNGEVQTGAGKGAIFRCESDGSGLEVYCTGLRNPQELAFDHHGNLFTFDNTGDIGDLARFVYALYGTDSGWDMAHQSPHHYVKSLDWGDFHPEKSMWVAEKLFEPYSNAQAPWVYPPASNITKGPSGITYLTGNSIPSDLTNKFLVTDYQGAANKSKTWVVTHKRNGAGYVADTNTPMLIQGIANSDVELGFDGKLYFCDYGGGWSINTNGSIQVLESTDPQKVKAGAEVAALFKQGFKGRSNNELKGYLSHPDMRVRQAAHLQLTQTQGGRELLESVANNTSQYLIPRLHAIWGLGKLCRTQGASKQTLINLLNDSEEEVRANAVRVLGDCRVKEAVVQLGQRLQDDNSPRVRALAAIALGRTAPTGSPATVELLYRAASQNQAPDVVIRHAILSALDDLATEDQALAKVSSSNEEERLMSVLFLRRKQSKNLAAFVNDPSKQIRISTIRAIYDTDAMDTSAGKTLATMDPAGYPKTVQRRIMAANYRLGTLQNAKRLVNIANNTNCDASVRKAALQGLMRWEDTVETDPVHGTYRPVLNKARTMKDLQSTQGELIEFVTGSHSSELISLGMGVAGKAGVRLDGSALLAQVESIEAPTNVRIAALNSLIKTQPSTAGPIINKLLYNSSAQPPAALQATALSHAYKLGQTDLTKYSTGAIERGPIEVARVAIKELAKRNPERWLMIWNKTEATLRPELKLDAYLALKESNPDVATQYLNQKGANAIFKLGAYGGDAAKGEKVYLNQGACGQCHKVGNLGQGVQGPNLAGVASRLKHEQLESSLYDPNADIAEGYGMASITKNDGGVVTGRIIKETASEVVIAGFDGSQTTINPGDIKQSIKLPSAMPNIVAALPTTDYRDLVAYLTTLTDDQARKAAKQADAESHGDVDEAVAK